MRVAGRDGSRCRVMVMGTPGLRYWRRGSISRQNFLLTKYNKPLIIQRTSLDLRKGIVERIEVG